MNEAIEKLVKELREEIANDIDRIDLSEAKKISNDYYLAALRTRFICSTVARKGLPNDVG